MIPKKYNTKSQKYKYKEDDFEDIDLLEEEIDEDFNEDTDLEFKDTSYEDDEENNEDDEEDFYKEDLKPKTAIIVKETIHIDESLPKKRGPKPNKNQFYVEPKAFDDEISIYYNTNVISDELATMISKIAHKLSYATNFINYTYRDEMVGDAIVRMMKALIARKYTHNKGNNPFSYFTKIAFNAFRNRIKKEKYIYDTLQKYQEEIIMQSEQTSYSKNKKRSNTFEDSATEE
jgi:hypothetical protein